MRDEQVMAMHSANLKRSVVLFKQFEFIKTREEAREHVFLYTTWREKLKWLWNPTSWKRAVDAVQRDLLNQLKKQAEEAAAKPVIHRANANGVAV